MLHAKFQDYLTSGSGSEEQVAQRATIAHLRVNFTFSYCKSMGDDDPRGLANLNPRGMIGRIYVGYH